MKAKTPSSISILPAILFLTLSLSPRISLGSNVSFSIVKTGIAEAPEATLMEGGELFKKVEINHSAILIKHKDEFILFDTGLGRNIDLQFKDMPIWQRPFFSYTKITPAIDQIPPEIQSKISRIFLSHTHWDHASGLADFPQICVAISESEKYELENIMRTATFPSQFIHPMKWCPYQMSSTSALMGFAEGYDIFGDQSAVLVPLPGHTNGSVGLILTTSTQKVFFVGDLTWRKSALMAGKKKFWPSSVLVDRNRKQLLYGHRYTGSQNLC